MNTGPEGDTVTSNATLLARVLQFGDSVLPIGGFAFSGGLESAIQKGTVHDKVSLQDFARTCAEQASRGDAIAVIRAHSAALASDIEELVRIDELVLSRKLSSETRSMSVRMGRKFAELGSHVICSRRLQDWRELVVSGATPGCYPVALAVNFAAQGLSARDAYVVHQYGVVSTILSAALRLMRVGHTDTQQMLFELCKEMDSSYEIAANSELEAMAEFAPMAEILASVHLKAHVRLFMN